MLSSDVVVDLQQMLLRSRSTREPSVLCMQCASQ